MAMAKNAAAKKNPDLIPKKRLPNPDPSTARAKKPKATANYRGSGMGASEYGKKKALAAEGYREARYLPVSKAERATLKKKAATASNQASKAKKAASAMKARRTTRSADPTPGRAPGR